MKYCFTNELDSREYIKEYRVVDNDIILSLGTGETYKIPYTKHNLDIILERINNQKNKPINKKKLDSQIISLKFIEVFLLTLFCIILVFIDIKVLNYISNELVMSLLAILNVFVIFATMTIIDSKIVLKKEISLEYGTHDIFKTFEEKN